MAGDMVPGRQDEVRMAWRPCRSKRMLQSIKRECQDCMLLFSYSSGFAESRLSQENNQERQ